MHACPVRVLFSDLDGTLVHYPKDFSSFAEVVSSEPDSDTVTIKYKGTQEERKCDRLTSLTGGSAYISQKTKALIQELRETGVIFVIITGARSSTYKSRRPTLPPADYEIFENGGRKLHNGVIDHLWQDKFVDEVGKISDRVSILPDLPPPSDRDGTLWKLYDTLVASGWRIDCRDYITSFRVDVRNSANKSEADFDAEVRPQLPSMELAASFNLGKVDIYPAKSGKANAARHILHIENLQTVDAVALFDDDNDLELGDLCGTSFLPGVTHENVLAALKDHPNWTLMDRRAFLGTEDALETILKLRLAAVAYKGKEAQVGASSSA